LPSSSSAVPRAALNVPMPDLHAMAIAIRDGAARIALLKARVAEQDAFDVKSSTGTPHFHFPTLLPMQQQCCLINPSPCPCHPPNLHSLLSLICRWPGWRPHPPTPEDASAIEGLVFEDNIVHPEDPHTSGEHVDPGNPGNLVPEYDSPDDMDVEVKVEEMKVEPSSEETAMAT
ncbi:hypothetical protein EDB19DRAFT_1840648, partial [Suillus lakei]